MDNLLYIIIGIALYLVIKKVTEPKVEHISTTDLKEMLKDKSVKRQYIDVRSEKECKERKLKEFKNIPVQSLKSRMSEINKETPVVLICAAGGRSMTAAKILSKAGYTNLINVKGGMNQYR